MAEIGIMGGGLIGAGWAALFRHVGHSVTVFDSSPDAMAKLRRVEDEARPVLEAMLPFVPGGSSRCILHPAGLSEADFVQECLPEDLTLKRTVVSELESHLRAETPIASSSSGFSPEQISAGLIRPERVLVGHPCNPPYLMPVVELVSGEVTNRQTVERALEIYQSAGRQVLRLNSSVPGHLINRLQAALWREMLHLWREGVADLSDIDKAVTVALAPRWCVVSPTEVFLASGGDAGMAGFACALGDEMDRWWQSLGRIRMDTDLKNALIEATHGNSVAELARRRDLELPKIMKCRQSAAQLT